MQVEINLPLGWRSERLGSAGDAQWAAVDHHLEQWLHKDVHVRREVGDEGAVELKVFERMLLAEYSVGELNLALVNLNVGTRKALRLGRLTRCRRRCGRGAGIL